jgi:hypothetical protein
LTEPFYRPRARVALGEYIEVMARSYNGPYHVYMLSAITCGVDLLGMMTTTPIWPSCLGHALYLYCMMTIVEAALVNHLGAILASHTHGLLKVPRRVRRKIK